MKLESHPQELTQVPFSKTECGVDFNINTDTHERLRGVLMEYPSFKTNFFELFFFRKASGWLRYGFQHIALKDNTVLILSPHIHQEWHIDESQTDYRFLIFRDDFLSTYLADPFFTYRSFIGKFLRLIIFLFCGKLLSFIFFFKLRNRLSRLFFEETH